jgi:aldehyde:ferredoxin oxidoreductase
LPETYRSNVCFFNLTTGERHIADTPHEAVRAFLGGRGLNMAYLYLLRNPHLDPLHPQNPLIIGTGLLTGTGVPNSSRWNVSAKSPESRALGDASCGGFFGGAMRSAGIDRLILTGKAPELSYIYIEDGRVELRDATPYRGMNTRDVQLALEQDLGHGIQVACIGEAGENLVRMSSIINGLKNSASRGGMGCIMGAKNIKAIVARPGGGIPIAYPSEFPETVKAIRDYLQASKVVKVLGRVGTPLLYEVSNLLGAIRTNNSQLNAFEDTLDAEVIHQYVEKMVSCQNCVVHCRHRNTEDGEGPEYTTIGLLGANLGVADTQRVIQLNNKCNDLGLDVSSTSSIIAWAIELFEKGYLTKEDTDGRELKFGDADLVEDLMVDISKRQGLGDLLAESTQAATRFPPEASDFLIAIKGLPQSDPHDVRYLKGFALGIATASRGADHLRSRPTLEIFQLPESLREKIYGVVTSANPTDYDTKEIPVAVHETIYAVIDSLGICKFVCHGFNSPKLLGYQQFRQLIRLVVGWEISDDELKALGTRVVNLERFMNLREGLTRQDDTLPGRYFNDPMPLKLAKGHHIDRHQFDQMLTRYYQYRGWNDEGVPSQEARVDVQESLTPLKKSLPVPSHEDSTGWI